MVSLSQIKCFIKVAELRSFTKAASDLYITPTAVSKQIKNLENIIDHQLFIRDSKDVQLTNFAKSLYVRFKHLNNELEDIVNFIDSEKDESKGSLKVLVSRHLAKDIVCEKLEAYLRLNLKVHLEVILTEDTTKELESDADIMFGFAWARDDLGQWKSKKLFTADNILCASPHYIDKKGVPKSPDELINHDIVSHTLRAPNKCITFSNGAQYEINSPRLTANDFEMLQQACLDGLGILQTGKQMIQKHLDSGDLVELLNEYKLPSYDIFIFYRDFDYDLPKIRSFVNYFIAE